MKAAKGVILLSNISAASATAAGTGLATTDEVRKAMRERIYVVFIMTGKQLI